MSYPNAIEELRMLLGDTSVHKRATRKKLIGNIDADNTSFRTYDKRILGDTLELFVNNAAVAFTLDDEISGEVTLAEAPAKNSKVEASYYWQWWTDDEMKAFLNKGAESTGQFTNVVPDQSYLAIQAGLRGAALDYAACFATRSLIAYLTTRKHSAEFLIEQDKNDDMNFSETIKALTAAADSYWKTAQTSRDDFYKRLGKRNAPAFAIRTPSNRRYGSQT